MRTDTEQAKLEYLEQATGTCTDNDDVGRDFAQNVTPPIDYIGIGPPRAGA
jgi:hypothetical protein